MKITQLPSLILAGATLTWGASQADAQHQLSYRIDHQSQIVYDNDGHVFGRYHLEVIHWNSTYVVPDLSGHQPGSYYVQGGAFYNISPVASELGTHTNLQPTQIPFGGFSRVDDLASRLEALSNDFCLDLHYNYAHNPSFRGTYDEAYQVLEVAKYIHAAEHQNGRLAIQEKLKGFDQLVHHIQGEIQSWSRHHNRRFGQLGILSKSDLIGSTLHHLMNDVGVKTTPVPEVEQAPPPVGGPEQLPLLADSVSPILSSPPPTLP